jgi:hypothetical protein
MANLNLTAKQTKCETLKQWHWYKKNPGKSKGHYFKEVKNLPIVLEDGFSLNTNIPIGQCYLCDYISNTNVKRYNFENSNFFACPGCPLYDNNGKACGQIDQPFRNWELTKTDEDKAKYAQEIVDLVTAWEV